MTHCTVCHSALQLLLHSEDMHLPLATRIAAAAAPVAGGTAFSAVPAASPRLPLYGLATTTAPRKTCQDVHDTVPASRRRALQRIAAAAAAVTAGLGSAAGSSEAAVPTIDEYYIGSGTLVRPPPGSEATSAAAADSEVKAVNSRPDFDSALRGAAAQLAALGPLVEKQAWDAVVAGTRAPPLALLKGAALSTGSPKALARALGVSASKAGEISELAAEAGVTLQQLEDFAFSNRVIFFNSLDKSQVETLSQETNYSADLDEPRELLGDLKLQLQGIVAAAQ